jgi:radical SAM protein with 4Fe4S-binding SPASM domain
MYGKVFKQLGQGIVSGIGYHYKKMRNKSMHPTFLVFQATNQCNSRCTMCNIWKKPATAELSSGDIRKILSSDFCSRVRWVNLTGGEPFMRKDFLDIIKAMNEHPRIEGIAIPSNGLMTERIVSTVKKSLALLKPGKFLSVTLSIDGFEKTHDEIRGVPGGYKRVMETLDRLARLRRPSFNVGVQPTIVRRNIDEIEEFYKFMKRKTPNVGFAIAMASDGYYANADLGLGFTEEDKGTIIEFLQSIIEKDPQYAYYYSSVIDLLRSGKRRFVCLAGFATAFMDPYGNVYPCPILSADKRYNFGNALKEPGLWATRAAQHKKGLLAKEKRCRDCLMMCDFVNVAKVEFFDFALFMMQHPKIVWRLRKKLKDISAYV